MKGVTDKTAAVLETISNLECLKKTHFYKLRSQRD